MDSCESSLLMCGALLFFILFAGPTKGWICVCLPWGGPRVGNPPPHVATCGSSSAKMMMRRRRRRRTTMIMLSSSLFCHCCCHSSSSPSSNSSSTLQASAPDSESVLATRISLMATSSIWNFVAISECRQSLALFRLFCVTGQSCRNLMPWRYRLLLQWQQNTSKAMMWLLCEIPAIWRCPRCYWYTESCMLHVTAQQTIKSTPAIQKACLWAHL